MTVRRTFCLEKRQGGHVAGGRANAPAFSLMSVLDTLQLGCEVFERDDDLLVCNGLI